VYDRHPSLEVECTLVLVDLSGNRLWTGHERSSHVLGFPQLLQFRPGRDTHTIDLQCSIPSETEYGISHLTTYHVLSTPP
jgi:hypothetical protein